MGKAAEHLTTGELQAVAERLFKITSKKQEELIGLCPVHPDKNPSFSYNPVKDICYCFSCGFKGDIITLWTRINGYVDEIEGFKAFCREHGIETDGNFFPETGKKKRKDEPPPLDDAYDMLGELPESWIRRLEEKRGWSEEMIRDLGIRLQTHYQAKDTGEIKELKKPERIAIPIRDMDGAVRNIRLYKPGAKKMKIISWGKRYGETRLFPAVPKPQDPVLLCEGESDTICALSFGFNAISQTSKPKKWSKRQLQVFKDRHVVIAFDADQPGQDLYAGQYAGPEIAKVAKSVRVVAWPDFMGKREDGHWPEDHGQDLTDFFVRHKKTTDDLQALIDDAQHFTPPVKDFDGTPLEYFSRGATDGRLSFRPRLLAEDILKEYRLLSDPDTGLMFKWNGVYLEPYHVDHVRRIAISKLGEESTRARADDAASQVKILSTIPADRAINDCTDYLCINNGMLNVRSLELREHDFRYFATNKLNVSYNPDAVPICERWLEFMDQNIQTEKVIMQVQEFFGYCLYRKTPFAKALLALGPGSDGKSTMLNILRELVGRDNVSSIALQEMEDQFLRSSLYQKMVNISTEVGSRAIESPYFKAITAGDPINAAFKHQNTFTFTPYAKQIFAANKLPRVLDNSDGYYRRILPIQFKRQFLENDPDTDPFLENALMEELTGIFHWSLIGLHRLLDQGRFTDCEETRELLMSYKRLNNPIVCFIEDECTLGDDYTVAKAELYERYEGYCRTNRYKALSRENFFRELYAAANNLKTSRPRKNNPARRAYISGIRPAGHGV